jgi:hypothetical protein
MGGGRATAEELPSDALWPVLLPMARSKALVQMGGSSIVRAIR